MTRNYRATFILIFAALIPVNLYAGASYSQVTNPPAPPPPEWVDADGKVNLDKAPREVPALDADGKLAKDANGSDKMVPTYIGAVPPPPLR